MEKFLRILFLLCLLAPALAGKCRRNTTTSANSTAFSNATSVKTLPLNQLPKNFDWSNVNGTNHLTQSWNQHIPTYCGSCWVHGSLSSVQDRIKISKGAMGTDVSLARQSLLNCGQTHGYGNGCHGGSPQDVFGFMHTVGLPDDTCQIYAAKQSEKCDEMAMCMNCMPVGEDLDHPNCWAVKNFTKYRVTEYGKITDQGLGLEAALMSEIYARGPVVCGIVTDDNFDYNYTGGVWATPPTSADINHDIEVTGWGVTEEGTPFWQIRNSWGSYWGENGFAKLLRGDGNFMKLTDDCWFPLVDIEEETLVTNGTLTGSMYGLVPKDPKLAKANTDFLNALQEQSARSNHPDFFSDPLTTLIAYSSYGVALLVGLALGSAISMFMMRKRSQYELIK